MSGSIVGLNLKFKSDKMDQSDNYISEPALQSNQLPFLSWDILSLEVSSFMGHS